MKNGEKGQALPLVLLALVIGSLVITPFIGHASSRLIGSRIYGQAISEGYSSDAGIEHAIWRLTNDGLADELLAPGASTSYILSETINDIAPSITVTKMNSSGYIYALPGKDSKHFWRYDIAGNTWEAMADLTDKVRQGGALTYDGSYIYALRGNDKKNFWRYDIANDAWAHMANTPEKVKEGGALTGKIVVNYRYEIVSTADDNVIRAVVRIEGETVSILSWEVE